MRTAVIQSVYKNNKPEYLAKSITSILLQSYRDFDYYIGIDGPIGKELRGVLDSITDKRIRVVENNENKGLAGILNDLLELCQKEGYDYIARMDSDDVAMLNRFEKQLEYFDSHPEVECLGTWAVEILSDGREYYRKQMPENHNACRELFRKRDCMIHPTVMFRRSYIEKAGLYSLDTFFGEDTMMWAQGFAAGCVFANVPEFLFRFRLDDNFFNRRRGWKYAKGIWQLRHRVNKMLGFGVVEDAWAIAYAIVKMMPTYVLNLIYKNARVI